MRRPKHQVTCEEDLFKLSHEIALSFSMSVIPRLWTCKVMYTMYYT